MSQKKYPSQPDRKPLGSIQVPGFTSIRIEPGQRYTVYPPKPGTNNFCVEPCAHFGCLRARFDASQDCPECHQIIGYGGAVPVYVPNITTTEGKLIYSHNSILLIHANCYDQLVAKQYQKRIDDFRAAGQPEPENPYLTMELNNEFLQELQENPTGLFAKLYLDFRDTPKGIDNTDPRLAIWVMEHTYPGNVPGGAPAPMEGEPEETTEPGIYTYLMLNRPAGYGTCPDGRLVDLDKTWEPSETSNDWGTVSYPRKLTDEELYRYEMAPQSDNAFKFQVGDRVLVNECDEATVTALVYRGRYEVKFDSTGSEEVVAVKSVEPLPSKPTEPEPPKRNRKPRKEKEQA